ncbi:MAG: cytochrome P460 family protein [Pseudomonadota bacterium]
MKGSAILTVAALIAATTIEAAKAEGTVTPAKFTTENHAIQPEGWRQWIFVGAPLTPHALNDGAAPFPEFHNVYVEPSAFAHFVKTGEWAEGTQLAKELALIYQNDNDEVGATYEVSGRGYQQGEFAGLELVVKDSSRFPDMPGGWTFFSFGHHAPPYAATAEAFPAEACNACHESNADTDYVFTQFYPVLRAVLPTD